MEPKSSKVYGRTKCKIASNRDLCYEKPHSELLFDIQIEWLDSTEAAAYLRVSVGALRNMTSNGHIPYHKLGKRNRYRLEDLRNLLLSQKRGGFHGN